MSDKLSPEIYRSILEGLPTAVYLVDRDRRILLWNRGAEELTGYLRQEVIGRSCRDDLLMHCDENQACLCGVACPLQKTMLDGHPRAAEVFLLHKNGNRVPVTVRAAPIHDEAGLLIGAVECFEKRPILLTVDVALRQVSQGASLDEVTGILGRAGILAGLQVYVANYTASPLPFGVLTIAVDGLDRLRHADGRNGVNAVLYATAQTLASMLGPNDMIGRWSEERFVAVVNGCTASTLLAAAGRMKRMASLDGVPWWGDRITVTLSMGGAVVRDGDTPETLVSRAEAALESGMPQTGDRLAVA